MPIAPGSDGAVSDRADALRIAAEIGFPVLLKAAAGGGGRGMRIVRVAQDLPRLLDEAMSEALTAFGDAAVYVERYLGNVRHIEVQVLGDGERVIHLGERDCSIQRRNQKLVEEAPSSASSTPGFARASASPRCGCASTSATAAPARSSTSSTWTAASSSSWK